MCKSIETEYIGTFLGLVAVVGGLSSSPWQELTEGFLTLGGWFLNCFVKLPWWLKW